MESQGTSRASSSPVETNTLSRAPRAAALLAVALVGLLTYAVLPDGRSRALGSELLVVGACLVGVVAITRWSEGWPSARAFRALLSVLGLAVLAFFVLDVTRVGMYEPRWTDLSLLAFLVPLAFVGHSEFASHFDRHDQREIAVDVVLLALSLAAIAFLTLLPSGADTVTLVAAAVFATIGAAGLAVTAAIALWVPTRAHLLVLVGFVPACLATLRFGWEMVRGAFDGTSPMVDVPLIVAPLAIAGALTLVSHDREETVERRARWARPALASMAVVAACAALALVAIVDDARGLGGARSTVIIVALGIAVAVRILSNQHASTEAHDHVRDALAQRESALDEAAGSLEHARRVYATLRDSEEHLRLVFEAAVDGFVELDEAGTVMQANEAFCRMINLDRSLVEGRRWTELAAVIAGASSDFAELPTTGTAQLVNTEGQPLDLEARVSSVPTDPPRTLLLVRDVTAAKVADRTIRSLFQFLQDRDEDRSRLLRRTNAAIEHERNRIARDLHDGPVQGVSAASLSLEAALLMIKAGDVERGLEVVSALRQELAEEADSLRRLMAGLRPPVLEERGLMPALRESLSRFGTANDLRAEFGGRLEAEVADDLETLAYRVVQESLANVAKHAGASSVNVHVSADQDSLRVEIDDDGQGFDTSQSRGFLADGRVGLASMRERVELASGTFTVRSTEGRGTTVIAVIPLDAASITVTIP